MQLSCITLCFVAKNKIVEFLFKVNKPVTALELIDLLRVNKTTVYRQIKSLIKEKVITEIEFGDGKKRYELSSLPHHHHIVCINCNLISDITLKENFSKPKTNFKILKHNLEFFGICKNCQ